MGDENPPWTNRPQSSVFGAKAVVWSGATEFSSEEVKLWVCDNHTSTQRAGEREGGKRASHMFHSWAFVQVKRLSEVFTDTVLSSSLLLDSPPQDERSGDGTRTRLTDAACANGALPLLVLPFADRSAATADIRIALWEARLTSGASGERVFAYGCFCHRLSCRSLGVWLREESGSLLAQCAAAGSRVSSGNFMPISGCSQCGQWIAVAHGSRRQFPGAEFAHLMGFYHRWRQNVATKGLCQLEPWYNKDNNNFLPRFNSQLRWDKTLKEVLKRTTLRLNLFFFLIEPHWKVWGVSTPRMHCPMRKRRPTCDSDFSAIAVPSMHGSGYLDYTVETHASRCLKAMEEFRRLGMLCDLVLRVSYKDMTANFKVRPLHTLRPQRGTYSLYCVG